MATIRPVGRTVQPDPIPPSGRPSGRDARWRTLCRAFFKGLLGRAGTGDRDPLGPEGERIAARHLQTLGFRILARNVRVRGGEADLIAQDPDGLTIVLVEVKARRVDPLRSAPPQHAPEASVHARKRRKLRRILRRLVVANRWHDRPVRIDVVAVEVPSTGSGVAPTIRHTPNAVDPRAND